MGTPMRINENGGMLVNGINGPHMTNSRHAAHLNSVASHNIDVIGNRNIQSGGGHHMSAHHHQQQAVYNTGKYNLCNV